jgi:hypothetical protein
MLNKDRNERPSAADVLNSEWMISAVGNCQNDELGIQTIKQLSNFHVLSDIMLVPKQTEGGRLHVHRIPTVLQQRQRETVGVLQRDRPRWQRFDWEIRNFGSFPSTLIDRRNTD